MTKAHYRAIQLFLIIFTLIVLFVSLYFQYVVGMQPCPLCIMQRICVFLLLVIMGFRLSTLKKAHFISMLQIIVASLGCYFAIRQLWLQSLPEGLAPACTPTLDILMRYFPWQETAKALFWGAGDCAEKTWSMWGVTMPGWSALYFLITLFIGIFLYIRTRTSG